MPGDRAILGVASSTRQQEDHRARSRDSRRTGHHPRRRRARGTSASRASASWRWRCPGRCPPSRRASSTRPARSWRRAASSRTRTSRTRIMSHPDAAVPDPRPRGGHRGHGLRRHDDPHRLRLRAAGAAIIQRRRRAARGALEGQLLRGLHLPHHAGGRAADLRIFEQIPEAIQAGFPSFKVFTTNVLPPHPKRAGNRIDFGRIHYAMEKVAPAGGIMVVHGEDEDLVQFNYERFREEKRMEGANLHLVHTKLSESLAFRAHHRARAGDGGGRLLRPHLRAARAWRRCAEARAPGPAHLRARRCTSTPASTPSTTRRRAASARTPIRR